MFVANKDIRDKIKRNALFMYRVAVKIGCHENTLIRWLRKPLSAERRKLVEQAIDELILEDIAMGVWGIHGQAENN